MCVWGGGGGGEMGKEADRRMLMSFKHSAILTTSTHTYRPFYIKVLFIITYNQTWVIGMAHFTSKCLHACGQSSSIMFIK